MINFSSRVHTIEGFIHTLFSSVHVLSYYTYETPRPPFLEIRWPSILTWHPRRRAWKAWTLSKGTYDALLRSRCSLTRPGWAAPTAPGWACRNANLTKKKRKRRRKRKKKKKKKKQARERLKNANCLLYLCVSLSLPPPPPGRHRRVSIVYPTINK